MEERPYVRAIWPVQSSDATPTPPPVYSSSQAPGSLPRPEQRPAMRPPPILRVLIADDHRLVRQSLAALLDDQPDMEVVGQAANGREAVELCHQHHPDLVLMDIIMPEVDGIEATRQIHHEMPDIRVVALSMFNHTDLSENILAAGAVDYVSKVDPPEDLLAVLRA